MEIPTNIQTYDTPLSTIWIDGQGILCSVAKKDVPLTIDRLQNVYTVIHGLTNGKKICTLTIMTNVSTADRETRAYASKENAIFTKAMALVAESKVSSFIANLFIGFQKSAYPIKVFSEATEAKKWLSQYL